MRTAPCPTIIINSGDQVFNQISDTTIFVGQRDYQAGWQAGQEFIAGGAKHALFVDHQVTLQHKQTTQTTWGNTAWAGLPGKPYSYPDIYPYPKGGQNLALLLRNQGLKDALAA